MTLRDLTDEVLRLLELAETEDMDEEALKDTFEALSGEFETKADAYANVRAELKADASKLDEEIKRLTARKTTIENNIKGINKMLMWAMETTGKTKFKTDLFSFGIAKNGGVPPLEIYGFVPNEFTKVEVSNDTEKIRAYVKEHPECEWARFGEVGTHLNIR